MAPPGEARPGWKILRVLGNLLEIDGFAQDDAFQVRDELAALADGTDPFAQGKFTAAAGKAGSLGGLLRLGDVPLYAVDPLVRRAAPLQETADAFPKVHFALTVDEPELERAAKILAEHGVETSGPIHHEWMNAKSLYFSDPDGHDLELCAPL